MPILLFMLAVQASPVHQGPVDVAAEREAWVMGTRLRVVAEASSSGRAEGVTERVLTEVERLDALLSTWSPTAEMSHVNRAAVGVPMRASSELLALLVESRGWARATGGAFQPTIGPLIEAWDLRGGGRVPDPDGLRRAMRASDPDLWRLDVEGGLVERRDTSAWLDTGAFGKGAALRSAERFLRDVREVRWLADLGGQLWARAPADDPWRVPVAHPTDRETPAVWLRLHDVSAATSGTSERWIEVEGERFGHLIDPRDGRPAPAWGTVTVVHADAFVADVLATALYVMGPEQGPRWLARHPDIAALFLEVRGDTLHHHWTPAMERWLEGPPATGVEHAGRDARASIAGRTES